MKGRGFKLTGLIISAFVALAVIADLVLIQVFGKQASISAWFIVESEYHPMIAFCSGFLCGHLFWRMREDDLPKKESKE